MLNLQHRSQSIQNGEMMYVNDNNIFFKIGVIIVIINLCFQKNKKTKKKYSIKEKNIAKENMHDSLQNTQAEFSWVKKDFCL